MLSLYVCELLAFHFILGKRLNNSKIHTKSSKFAHGQPSEQLFPKRWPLSTSNRTNNMNEHKVKCYQNSDIKTGNREPQQNYCLGPVSMSSRPACAMDDSLSAYALCQMASYPYQRHDTIKRNSTSLRAIQQRNFCCSEVNTCLFNHGNGSGP